jgi:AhpC/TSA family protein
MAAPPLRIDDTAILDLRKDASSGIIRLRPAHGTADATEHLKRRNRMRRGLIVPALGLALGITVLGGLASLNRVRAQEKKDAMPEPTVKVGDMAPDFTLRDTHGKEVSLHDFRGKKSVALAFYVFAFTGG